MEMEVVRSGVLETGMAGEGGDGGGDVDEGGGDEVEGEKGKVKGGDGGGWRWDNGYEGHGWGAGAGLRPEG